MEMTFVDPALAQVLLLAVCLNKERAVEVITQVLGVRLASIRSAVEIVDGLSEELALGPLVDFKQIRFSGLEELIAGAEG